MAIFPMVRVFPVIVAGPLMGEQSVLIASCRVSSTEASRTVIVPAAAHCRALPFDVAATLP
jgi:hypothetical protein